MRRLTLASLCALFAAPMCLYAQVGVGGEVQAVTVPGGQPTALVSEAGLSPLGIADTYITYEGRALTIAGPGPLVNDLDPDGEAIILSNFFQPDNGTLTSIVTSGAFTYTPNAGFTGTDSFRYILRDASGNFSEPVTVTIEVLPGAPRGTPDTYGVLAGTTLTIAAPGPLANDLDPDGESIILSNFFQPDNGTLTSIVTNGAFTYVPEPGFTGTDSFRYILRDASGNFSEPITVTILVIDPNATDPDPIACFDPAKAPSYAGGYVLNAAETRAFVRVEVPQGGTTFEFYNTSNLTVGMPEDAAENPFPGVSRTGDTFTFAPASPATVLFPITTAGGGTGVSFYLRVTDTCGRTVDVDPSFALDAVAAARFTLALDPNAPNPFSDETVLRFTLAEAGHTRLVIYDALGREIARLLDAPVEAGPHVVRFDARNLPSGVYIYRLTMGEQVLSRTLTVVR